MTPPGNPRPWIALALAAATAVVLQWPALRRTAGFDRLEESIIDLRLRARHAWSNPPGGPAAAGGADDHGGNGGSGIVIVGLAESTLALAGGGRRPGVPGALGASAARDAPPAPEGGDSAALRRLAAPPPWDREVYADLLDQLFARGARLVVFDLLFNGSAPGDLAFTQAILRHHPKVVLASAFLRPDGPPLPGGGPGGEGGQFRSGAVHHAVPVPPLERPPGTALADLVGFAEVRADPWDRVVRRTRLRASLIDDALQPDLTNPEIASLATLAYRRLTSPGNSAPAAAATDPGSATTTTDRAPRVDFRGPAGWIPRVPIEAVFHRPGAAAAPPDTAPPGRADFRDKIVLVGPITSALRPHHRTPLGPMPAVEIHAHTLASLLGGSFLRIPGPAAGAGLGLLLATAAALLGRWLRGPAGRAAAAALLALGYLAASQAVFHAGQLALPALAPLLGLGVFAAAATAGDLGREWKAREEATAEAVAVEHL